MTSPTTTAAPRDGKPHWIVATNYRLRVGSLGMCFIAIVIEWWGRASPVAWAALALGLLVYPHAAYVLARRARDSKRAEYVNLVADSLMIGMVLAGLHFPLWLSFSMFIGSSMNSTICRGVKGLWRATAALLAGAAAGVAMFGFKLEPDAGWIHTILVIAGTAAYLLAIAISTYLHNQQLRDVRNKLRLGEQALNESNQHLQTQLAEITRLQAQLNEQAIRDPLTGLFNRRYLDTIVPQELARCVRAGASMAVMMIDIDHFKSINDRFGHQGGDEVLKALATLLIDSVRASDVACRFGGEEFMLVLPHMAAHSAGDRAEQWRRGFEALTVESNGSTIQATMSIGLAVYPQDGADLHELVRAADAALYRAKAAGRNRVAAAASEAVTPAA